MVGLLPVVLILGISLGVGLRADTFNAGARLWLLGLIGVVLVLDLLGAFRFLGG